jgi:hypothetical protein
MAGSLIAGYLLSTTAAAAAAAGGLAAFQFAAVAFAANMVVGRVVSKIFAPGRQQQPEAGSRVQLPPATGNSLGVFYGSSWLKPVVSWASDAGNKRMYYVLDFGIAPETAHTITFGEIKWEGKTLNFDDQNAMLPPGPVYISGRSVGGSVIAISDNGIPIGSTTSETNGDWSYTGTFTDGVHNITATETYIDPYSGNPTTVSITDFSPKNFTITSNLSLIKPSPNVVSWRDSPSADFPEGYLDAKVANKIKVYRFTNGYNSSATNDPRTAIQILQDSTIPVDKRVDNNFLKSKTVFLIVELEYFEPAGITRLGEITVQLTNSISSPGSAILDYLTNPYYGWGLPLSSVDTVSLSNLDAYSNELITYTYKNSSGVIVTGTRKRFTINGPVPSSNPVINNIKEIADSCDCWVKFNETTGKWGVAINKGYDQAAGTIPAQTIGQLFSVNPDNMIGSISLGSLDLNSTYNRVEVSYVDYDQVDQAGYSYIDLDAVDRNPNEPDNILSINLPYVNTYAQAKLIGQRKLIQSRENAAINSLLIDWSGIQLEPGDVIRITDSVYNWNDKLFKVLQVTEVNDSELGLHASLNVMEYSEQSYQDDLDISDYSPVANTGFDNPDITVRPDAPYFSNLQPSIIIPEFTVNAIVPLLGVYNAIELWFSTDPNPADITKYSKYATVFSVGGAAFTPGSTVQQIYTGAPAGDYFAVSRAVTLSGEYSGYSNPSLRLAWAPSIESVAGFTTEVIPAAVFCSADFDGSNVVVGQTTTLTVRSGPNIVAVWDGTGVQPDSTWYAANLSTTAGLTTGLLLTDTINNTAYFTVTGLTVDIATATINDIYYKPSGSPLINIGEAVVQVTKVKNGASGTPGTDGKQYNTAYLYQWNSTTPANPSGSSTFVWATGTNTLYTGAGGWTVGVPTNPGTPGMKLWISSKSVDDLANVATTVVSWTSGYAISQSSQNGDNGAPGLQTSYPEVYQWTAGGTPTISGTSTYTWALGTFTPVPAGWSTSIPTSPSAGYTLWAARADLVEAGGVLTSTIDWTTSSIISRGYAGNNGAASVIADMSSEVDVIPTASDGTGYTLPANNAIRLYVGGVIQTTGVTYSGTATKNGLTATVNATTGAVTYTGASWTSTRETFTFTATYLTIPYTVTYTIVKGVSGSDSILPDLASETDIVAALSNGTGYTLPTGNGLRLYKGATIVTTGVTYSGTTTKNGLTATINATTGVITLSGASWTSDSESFTFTATLNAVAYTSIYTIAKGKQGGGGLNGTRTAILDVYRWSATVPTTFPSGTSTYTWATSQFTLPATPNSWSLAPGAGSAGQTLYIARQTYADTSTTATSSVTWSTSTAIAVGVYGSDGAPGSAGESVYTADVFIQSATAPTAPSGGSYNFSTGVLVAPSSWSVTQPSTTTTPTYAASFTFSTTTPGTTVSGGTWTNVRIVAVSGGSGVDGTSVFVGSVYLQQATQPTAPSGGSYNFSTNIQVAPTGWVVSQPTSTTTPTWLSYYTFSTTTPGTTVAGGGYSTPVIDAQNGAAGAPGANGLNGTRTAILEVYQWAAAAPTTFPSGSSTYTWATGAFTLPATPNSWSLTPGAATAGYTLWATRVVYSDSLTTATSSITWPGTNTAYAVGAAGTNGAPGGTGNQGASARRAYSRIPGNPSPVSGQITVVGDGRPTAAQSNTTWGLNYSWSATDPNTSSTDSLFQSDGVYDPATGNTVWDTPYLSSLRVGTLSAITTNTGNLTVSGQILAGTAALSGNTITGAGSIIYSDGKFAMGTTSSYIINNGTEVIISGFDTVASSSSTLLALSALNPGTAVGSVSLTKAGKGTVKIDGYISVYLTSATVFNYYDVTIRFGWKNTVQPSLALSMLSTSQAAVFRNPSANEYVIAFPVSAQLPLNFSIADTYTAYIQKVGIGLWNAAGTPTNVTNTAVVVWNGWTAFQQTRI